MWCPPTTPRDSLEEVKPFVSSLCTLWWARSWRGMYCARMQTNNSGASCPSLLHPHLVVLDQHRLRCKKFRYQSVMWNLYSSIHSMQAVPISTDNTLEWIIPSSYEYGNSVVRTSHVTLATCNSNLDALLLLSSQTQDFNPEEKKVRQLRHNFLGCGYKSVSRCRWFLCCSCFHDMPKGCTGGMYGMRIDTYFFHCICQGMI